MTCEDKNTHKKAKNTKRDRTKIEFNIVISGQLSTLAMFFFLHVPININKFHIFFIDTFYAASFSNPLFNILISYISIMVVSKILP